MVKTAHVAVNFGDDAFYTGTSSIPEGSYACYFNFELNSGQEGGKKHDELFGVRVKAYPLDGSPVKEKFLSMGTGAVKLFRPHPENPTQMVLIPGVEPEKAKANNLTSWSIFFDSLKNAGLPPTLVTDDLDPLNGVWLEIGAQPEPASWSQIGKQNAAKKLAGGGAAEAEAPRTPGMVVVVKGILPGGEPWEDGGGMPEAAEAAKSKAPAAKPAAGKAPVKPAAGKAKPKGDVDLAEIAQQALSAVLGDDENKAGMSKSALLAQAFEWTGNAYDDAKGQELMEALSDKDTLSSLIEELGYTLNKLGNKVVPA